MSDLLARLRMGTQEPLFNLRQEAADEIERLAAEVDYQVKWVADLADDLVTAEETIERLREGARDMIDEKTLSAENALLRDQLRLHREALIIVTGSLTAAVSLLQNGGKKAAASDTMFEMMLSDYRKAIREARDILRASK